MHFPRIRHRPSLATVFVLAIFASPAAAQVEVSTDITVDTSAGVAADEDVVVDPDGAAAFIDLGTLPAAADLVAHSMTGDGDELFVLDVTSSLAGGIVATPRDVVRWDGNNYSLEFVGGDEGVPPGAQIDAVGVDGDGLLLSFDTTIQVDGVTAADEDLFRFESGAWTLFWDGSENGVPESADLDGADQVDGLPRLVLSFDTTLTLDGTTVQDEDVVSFSTGSQTFSIRLDGSDALDPAADVDAVLAPAPGGALWALASLLALGKRRTDS